MAHKKAQGGVNKQTDSNPKFRGVKLFGGQTVKAGNIIVRQQGKKYEAGENVYVGNDFTLHAAINGLVKFTKKKKKKFNGR